MRPTSFPLERTTATGKTKLCVFNNSRMEEVQYEQNNLGICQAQDRYSGSGQFSQMVFTGYHVSTNWQNFREGATIKCVLCQVCTATFNSFTSMPRKQLGKPCSEGPYIFPFSTKLKRKLPGHVCGSWDTKVAFKHPAFTALASEAFALIVTSPPSALHVALCGLVQMGHWPCVTPQRILPKY